MPEEKTPLQAAEDQERSRRARIVWRDFSFLVLGSVAASVMSYIELNSADVEMRGGDASYANQSGIVDAGFIATQGIHDFLEKNRGWNDIFAFVNTTIGVITPLIYMVYQTVWIGDYDIIFRYVALSALRAYCGFFTYLPPDPSYLLSYYDFPDITQCLLKDCGDPALGEVNPFVSFFSGHVATCVATANHMYLHGNKKLGIFFHVVNIFQIIRLLATRGHYSIDIIIGWFMAAYVSNPAGRLGRHYSRGQHNLSDFIPTTAQEAFEKVTGIEDARDEVRITKLLQKQEVKEAFLKSDTELDDIPEPTAKLVYDGKLYPMKLE